MGSKKEKLTFDQKLELAKLQLETTKTVGRGLIEIMKTGPVPRYTITSLALLAAGKACVLSPLVVGTLQTANTIISIHEVIDESGGSILGLDEIGQTLTAIGGGVGIGALWAVESSRGVRGRGCPGKTDHAWPDWQEQAKDMWDKANTKEEKLAALREAIKAQELVIQFAISGPDKAAAWGEMEALKAQYERILNQ